MVDSSDKSQANTQASHALLLYMYVYSTQVVCYQADTRREAMRLAYLGVRAKYREQTPGHASLLAGQF